MENTKHLSLAGGFLTSPSIGVSLIVGFTIVKLIGECKFRFRLSNDNGESATVFDSFKYKTELKECLKKCEIKYVRKASTPQDRWKARDK